MKDLIKTQNGFSAYLVYDIDGEACNPRTETEHHTEILFCGTSSNHRAFPGDRKVMSKEFDERLADENYHSLDCTFVVGRNPGIALISISKEDFRKHYGYGVTPEEVLQSCAEEYSLWADGEVYGYVIEVRGVEEVDSCYGFIGEDHAKEAAIDNLSYWAQTTPEETPIPGQKFTVTF